MTNWMIVTQAEILSVGYLAQNDLPQAGAAPPPVAVKELVGDQPQTATTPAGNGASTTGATQGAAAGPFGGFGFIFVLVGVLGFMILMQVMNGRKERKKRDQMMSTLGRGDRILTIGGVIGTITELNDEEVVLKTEDARVRFTRSAISQVLKASGAPAPSVEVKARGEKSLA